MFGTSSMFRFGRGLLSNVGWCHFLKLLFNKRTNEIQFPFGISELFAICDPVYNAK